MASPINLTIAVSAAAQGQQSFDALIPGLNAPFSERVKTYNLGDVSTDMLADGWTTSDAEYKAAAKMAEQTPKVNRVKIGKLNTFVAQIATILVTADDDGTYSAVINGTTFSFAASSNTVEEIRDGIKAAIDAGSEPVTTATVSTNALKVTASNSGEPFTLTLAGLTDNMTLYSVDTVIVTGNTDGTYIIDVAGTDYTFTASSNSIAEIASGLVDLVNAGSQDITAALVGTTGVSLTPGVGQNLAVTLDGTQAAGMTLYEGQPNVGYQEGLSLIKASDSGFYYVAPTHQESYHILEAATFAESNRRLLVPQSADAGVRGSDTDDVASLLKDLSRLRTALIYHSDSSQIANAAWVSKKGAIDLDNGPLSIWAHCILSGVTTDEGTVDATAEGNIEGKNANYYSLMGTNGAVYQGKVSDGHWIDETVTVDWLYYRIIEDFNDFFSQLSNANRKAPGSEKGQRLVLAKLRERLDNAVAIGHLNAYTIDSYSFNSSTRTMTINWTAAFGGAIQSVTINGAVVAELPT